MYTLHAYGTVLDESSDGSYTLPSTVYNADYLLFKIELGPTIVVVSADTPT
jgi:hypothetical protein